MHRQYISIQGFIMKKTKEGKQEDFKIIMVGNSLVGKSCFLLRYVDDVFNSKFPTTCALDFRTKKVTKNGITFNMNLWDSAGQEKFRSIIFTYARHSKAACVVFDVTNLKSLEDCKYWFQQLMIKVGNDIPTVLIGNKSDILGLQNNQQIYDKQMIPIIRQYQQLFKTKYFLASSLKGDNVKEVFEYLFQELYRVYASTNRVEEGYKFKLKPIQIVIPTKKCC